MNRVRFTIYVPVRLNDGRTVPNRWVSSFEYRLAKEFGGFTRVEGKGVWYSPMGECFEEPVRLYHCDISNSAADFAAEKVRVLAEQVKRDLAQETVYVTRETLNVQTY